MAGQEAVLLEAKAKAAALAAAESAGGGGEKVQQKRTSGGPTRVRRIIQIPPSMTLEDEVILPTMPAGGGGGDVNGFANSAAGIKLAKELERKNNKNNKRGKKRKGGGNGAGEDPALRYGEIPYDPARPCDYVSFPSFAFDREKCADSRSEGNRLDTRLTSSY